MGPRLLVPIFFFFFLQDDQGQDQALAKVKTENVSKIKPYPPY